jgi:hypothetical protein
MWRCQAGEGAEAARADARPVSGGVEQASARPVRLTPVLARQRVPAVE